MPESSIWIKPKVSILTELIIIKIRNVCSDDTEKINVRDIYSDNTN